jgi:hypothetical protein
LPQGVKKGPLMRFLAQFSNILIDVLLAAGFVELMLSLWLDASIILAVVVLNAVLGFLQEGRAEQALASIRDMLSAEARVLRDGETRLISAEDLAPGDNVLLESGDKIPADLRLDKVSALPHRYPRQWKKVWLIVGIRQYECPMRYRKETGDDQSRYRPCANHWCRRSHRNRAT